MAWFNQRPKQQEMERPNVVEKLHAEVHQLRKRVVYYQEIYLRYHRELQILNRTVQRKTNTIKKLKQYLKEEREKNNGRISQ